MTTNNHPAHGPVSLERLHQIRETLSKAAAQSDGGNLGYAMADAVKVIDGVIAAFDAAPVWKYLKGNYRHFIKAPDWATLRTRVNGGDAWLERREIGALFIAIGKKKDGAFAITHLPLEGEEIIAIREKI